MIESVNPIIMVFIISAAISFTLAILQKILVNQDEMKKMNNELKELNKKFKEAQKNNNQKEILKLQPKMMQINSKKMSSSMKPMMASFVIIIPIFVFLLPGLYGDLEVELNDSLEGVAELNGIEKEISVNEDPTRVVVQGEEKEIIEMGEKEFALKDYNSEQKKLTLKRVVVEMPFNLPIWGSHIGWLGWYILVSLTTATIFRKALGVVQ